MAGPVLRVARDLQATRCFAPTQPIVLLTGWQVTYKPMIRLSRKRQSNLLIKGPFPTSFFSFSFFLLNSQRSIFCPNILSQSVFLPVMKSTYSSGLLYDRRIVSWVHQQSRTSDSKQTLNLKLQTIRHLGYVCFLNTFSRHKAQPAK